MKNLLNSAIWGIFSFVFPENTSVRSIERMGTAEFQDRAKRGDVDLGLSFPIYSLFSYSDLLVRQSIRQVKYKKNSKITLLLATILKDQLPVELEDEVMYTHFVDPIIIPVPSHPKKQKQKGYNQTEFILEQLSTISSYEILFALEKIKWTDEQTGKDRKKRLQNVRGSFKVKEGMKEIIKGRNVIVFDDVVTTGATLAEAHRALKKAKARRIVGLTLAH